MYPNDKDTKIIGGVFFTNNDGEFVKLTEITNVEFEETIEDHDDEPTDLLESINEPVTISCDTRISFRALVRIIGFWQAIKYTIKTMLHKKD